MQNPNLDVSELLRGKISQESSDNFIHQPLFFRLSNIGERTALGELLHANPAIRVFDTIDLQLKELVKSRNPSKNFAEKEIENIVDGYLNTKDKEEYGVWVFYPWRNRLVHLLDESEFIEVRTNRNKHKITDRERNMLVDKKIGIIGLSVGKSVAVTLAMERVCGELRLADFDTLELSNLNRIRTDLSNLGRLKTVVAAREIAEIDPFIKISCFHDGITDLNIDEFLTKGGKIDLLIEECDSIDIKVLSRQKAKQYRIPVLMDTSDRGMLDIERYDLSPQYPPFHGLTGELDYQQLKSLSLQQKLPYILKLVGLNTASNRAKASLIELGSSITGFPQLASSVALGGAITTDVSRRILLDQLKESGRFYVDVENIIKDAKPELSAFVPEKIEPLDIEMMHMLSGKVNWKHIGDHIRPSPELVKCIVADAGLAPSSGNDQPWKWLFSQGRIILFHDISRSHSFGDYRNIASYISLGSSLENFVLSAHYHHLNVDVHPFPCPEDTRIIASIEFVTPDLETESHDFDHLYAVIKKRCTNRKITTRKEIDPEVLRQLTEVTESIGDTKIYFRTDTPALKGLGEIISAVDRIRILHPHGHHDFFKREMRWTDEEARTKRNGMDIHTLEIPGDALLALRVISDESVVKVLRDINGGQNFKKVSVQNTISSSAMGLVTVPGFSPYHFLMGGRAIQRQWLKATELGYAYQPLIAPLYLFPRIIFGNGEDLSQEMISELTELRKEFLKIFPGDERRGEVFLFRIFEAEDVEKRSLRLPIEEILFTEN